MDNDKLKKKFKAEILVGLKHRRWFALIMLLKTLLGAI
jgi:hypothetical protein